MRTKNIFAQFCDTIAEMNFEELANEHKDAVYRQMLRVCGNHADAEDVLMEALLKALSQPGTVARGRGL